MLIRQNRLSLVCSLLLVSAGSAAAQNAPMTTPTPTPITLTRDYAFPPVGLAGTETLQVNIANLASVPATSTATASCAGTVSFTNATGTAIGTPARFAVPAGQIFSVPLPFSNSGYSSRGEILATVQQTLSLPSSTLCSLSISLEVFDTGTGVTHAVLSAPTAAVEPVAILTPGLLQ
jgi:hypothetical protein